MGLNSKLQSPKLRFNNSIEKLDYNLHPHPELQVKIGMFIFPIR